MPMHLMLIDIAYTHIAHTLAVFGKVLPSHNAKLCCQHLHQKPLCVYGPLVSTHCTHTLQVRTTQVAQSSTHPSV